MPIERFILSLVPKVTAAKCSAAFPTIATAISPRRRPG
jgi:hypothetical protein